MMDIKVTKIMVLFLMSLFVLGCSSNLKYSHIYTDDNNFFVKRNLSIKDFAPKDKISLDIKTDRAFRNQIIEGFGACFNELGWVSLNKLPEKTRSEIMNELFAPDVGANFTVCRMPLGANDFSRDWYSYNETDKDFVMKNFSIDNDKETLIPFINQAISYRPDLKIWASPWCPPSWMKYNKHYASAYTGDNYDVKYRNGLPKDKVGKEGSDMFIQDSLYFKSYALYFKKFIQEYKKCAIPIYAVMPQNEFNSAQIFPSCCWTSRGLATFIGKYLGPEMEKEGVSVMFGTMERPNHLLVDSILQDKDAGKYIDGIGFQWAGKDAVSKIREMYPRMTLLQTEQECGNGKNDWKGLLHSWDLLKHYINCGVSIYDYWNISLEKGGISRWGWAQNSLVVVDPEQRTYRYTYEYYLMKHISHFVRPGAVYLSTTGTADETLTFMNPDKSIVILCMEKDGKDKKLMLTLNDEVCSAFIKANSINTIIIK